MMWLMLQQDKPDDYVVGTGDSHSIREFVDLAFAYVGIDLEWQGSGASEKAVVRSFLPDCLPSTSVVKVGDELVEVDPRYFRPTEVDFLQADITKAKEQLKWQPPDDIPGPRKNHDRL